MAYATLAEFKGFVGIAPADTLDDATLQMALDAATGQVDNYCGRSFAIAATTRYYYPENGGYVVVDPIANSTGLTVTVDQNNDGVYEQTWTVGTDYRLDPVNAVAEGDPWTRLTAVGSKRFPVIASRPSVAVAGNFGWPGGAAPAGVKHATLLQASRLWKRKDAPFGVAGSVEFGSEVRLLAKLDPDVESLLRPYRRSWWVI